MTRLREVIVFWTGQVAHVLFWCRMGGLFKGTVQRRKMIEGLKHKERLRDLRWLFWRRTDQAQANHYFKFLWDQLCEGDAAQGSPALGPGLGRSQLTIRSKIGAVQQKEEHF